MRRRVAIVGSGTCCAADAGRAPDSYQTGARCSRRMERRAAARSSASSSSADEMKTRTRAGIVRRSVDIIDEAGVQDLGTRDRLLREARVL
jgi:hypothetical protein